VNEQGLMSNSTHKGHSEDKSFQAIDCTGTDNHKQGNETLRTSET